MYYTIVFFNNGDIIGYNSDTYPEYSNNQLVLSDNTFDWDSVNSYETHF